MIRRLVILTFMLAVPAFISRLHEYLPSPLNTVIHNARHFLFGNYATLCEHLVAGVGMVFFCSAILLYLFVGTEVKFYAPELVWQFRESMQRYPVTYQNWFYVCVSASWAALLSYSWEVAPNIALSATQLHQIVADLVGAAIGVVLTKYLMSREWRKKIVTR